MPKKSSLTEQTISKLREVGVLLSQGKKVGEVSRILMVSEQTYYRWCKEYGWLQTDQAHRLKEVERENLQLKKLVANLSLDKAILQETVSGNF